MTTLDTDSAPRGLSTLVGFGHSAVGSSRPRETLETLRPVAAVKRQRDKTVNGMSTPRYTTTTDEPVSGAAGAPPVDPLAESIIYMCALIADQPRAIDRYIDYFGERRPVTRKALANKPSAPVASGPAVSNHSAATDVGTA